MRTDAPPLPLDRPEQTRKDEHAGHGGMAMADGPTGQPAMTGMAQEPGLMMGAHHDATVWVYPIVIALGAWLIASPATLGYPSRALTWSDIVSGALVIVFAWLARTNGRAWAAWATAGVGTWLIFAPLVFRTPDAASYLNDSLVGALLIAFPILIPHGMAMPGPEIPPGWSYNPSSWSQRVPIIALGLFGFFISRYLAAYQLGHTGSAWDPFFGDGTVRVLTSEVSRNFPVSDAGLGAAVYLLEVLMTWMGGPSRWRTMPWMVGFFALLVVPLGATSVVLVVLQPLTVGTWCTLCVAAAFAMLVAVPLMLDEVVAMGQFMVQSKREGKSLWRTFWLGGNVPEGHEGRPTRPVNSDGPISWVWGMSTQWSLWVATLLGGWLLLAPAVLGGEGGRAANGDRLVGALVITVAMLALAEVSLSLRFLNIPLGVWLLAQPWLLGATGGVRWSDVLVGLLLIAVSLPRGPVRELYGGWNRYIR